MWVMPRVGERSFPSHFTTSLLIAIASRIALFFGSMVVPIPNEVGLPISPLTANTALDLGYYLWARDIYFGEPQVIIEQFRRFFAGSLSENFALTGPLFPSLLHVFDYGQDKTLPLSAIYLLLSLGLVVVWLWWLRRQGVGPVWLYLFAVLPTPYWFMLNISTDLLFAVIVAAFWLLWFDERLGPWRRMTGLTMVVVIAGLSRPNALSLLLFLSVDSLIWGVALQEQREARRRGLLFSALIATIMIAFAVFYAPYFNWVIAGSAGSGYFGRLPEEYLAGLWPDLPIALNLGLSWLGLLGAKVLYLTGLRPSFGDTAAPLVLLRMLPGFIMLPGLVWLLLWANWRVRLFVAFFLAPILLGISQDRYVLPIQPVLFFYGTKAWGDIVQLSLRLRTIAA
jgi:hypothetical protein